MPAIYVQFKCKPGMAYTVAEELVDQIEEVSEVFSTSGHYDLIAKFYLGETDDAGRFVTERLQTINGVADTFTTVTFNAFGK